MLAEAVRVTREELYEQVWSEPMQKLAKKYGISDVGLAKTCRRMRVPLPGRGYWAKKQFGKTVRRIPLPKLPPSTGSGIRDFIVRKPDVSADTDETATGPVAEQARFESDDANRIQVADALTDPHPLIARTVAALRRAKPNEQGYLVPTSPSLDVYVSLDGADRAMCILDALLKGLDDRGYAASIRPGSEESTRAATVVRIGEEDIAISLSERVDVVELRDKRLAPKPQNVARARASWRPFTAPPVRAPRRELVSTGLFSLRIEREAREREWRAAEERRAQEARRREEETSRVRALDNVLSTWRDARDIRHYVADARAALNRTNEAPYDAREPRRCGRSFGSHRTTGARPIVCSVVRAPRG